MADFLINKKIRTQISELNKVYFCFYWNLLSEYSERIEPFCLKP